MSARPWPSRAAAVSPEPPTCFGRKNRQWREIRRPGRDRRRPHTPTVLDLVNMRMAARISVPTQCLASPLPCEVQQFLVRELFKVCHSAGASAAQPSTHRTHGGPPAQKSVASRPACQSLDERNSFVSARPPGTKPFGHGLHGASFFSGTDLAAPPEPLTPKAPLERMPP